MTDTNDTTVQPGSPETEAALESWKEIAAYLKRDVRTVKRWEKSEGLPVRRHLHHARSSVYAYPSELDAWWSARSPHLPSGVPAPQWERRHKALALTAMFLLILVNSHSGSPIRAGGVPQRTGPTLTEIFTGKLGIEINPDARFSPDGKFLAATDSGHVEVVDVETEKRTRLTEGDWNQPASGFAEGPMWSPDGTRVAYGWFLGGQYQLRVVAAAGGQPQVLFNKSSFYPKDWSPDGKQILGWQRHADGKTSLAMVSTSGEVTELRVWEKGLSLAGSAVFSPDGRSVAYGTTLSGSNQIFLLNLESRAEVPLTNPPISDRLPVWSRDGRSLLFVSDRGGRSDLWAILVRDGKPAGEARIVYSDIGEARTMCGWDSQGRLVFTRGVSIGQLYAVKVDPSSGATLGPPERPVLQFEGKHQMAVWSPDGKRLALLTQARGAPLYVFTGSGEMREFNIRELGWARIAGWLPSSDALAMSATPDGPTFGLYLIRLVGGALETLYTDRQTNWATVQLSPDGAAFAAVGGDTVRIVDLKQKQTIRELKLQPGEEFNGFAWAPDGRAVYAALGRRVVHIPIRSGEPQEIAIAQGLRSLALSPDGRTLAITRIVPDSKERYQLFVLSSSGGEPKRVQLPEGHRPWRVRWAPDGKIGYISFQAKQQFLRLSNFLPKTE